MLDPILLIVLAALGTVGLFLCFSKESSLRTTGTVFLGAGVLFSVVMGVGAAGVGS
jgi:Na+/phosphate symporter